ncbi:CpsD/CapB family tyrosine-protein kinase [Caldicoprobacter algeriensis]|uniref:CpsD/CapB family tyrosine-protein kinase n=1 Tax=Caldicoprobacter algeriensis TaxID=699281 RepID=UPI00207A800A|nr:CpsD/CapB family tyrosine-protein kinase [Caldicoprobacter algeriensis]MCM8901696.1 CpsD/CapB family tyrosine-protein kinase [Caldicoprobacter algeriensis]
MLKSTKLVTHTDPKSPIAEAYRILRTNIEFSSTDRKIKVILVTSSGPAEGKSTTAANMAIAMAEANRRVLLIDCDLRKPSIHRMFGLVNIKGLTNILVEGLEYSEITNVTEVENLEVITSGPKPPNPSELLGSQRMKEFLDKVREDYDVIIIDTPPVLPVTDAAVLSQYVDGVVLVAGYGLTTFDAAVQAKASLQKVNARILGVVLNGVPTDKRGGYYYYYYYYYDEHGRKQRRRKSTVEKPLSMDGISVSRSEGMNL